MRPCIPFMFILGQRSARVLENADMVGGEKVICNSKNFRPYKKNLGRSEGRVCP